MKTLNFIFRGFHALVGCVFAVLFLAAHGLAAEPAPASAPDLRTGEDGVGTGKRKLEGYRLSVFANAPLVGPIDPGTILRLGIGLPVKDGAGLVALSEAVSDPKSPNYRRFLDPEETIARFSPAESDYAALMAFAKSKGLKLAHTHRNRYLLDVSAPAATVERVMHVRINNYRRPDGTVFYALDREPSIDYEGPLLFIGGLDDYFLAKRGQVPFAGTAPLNYVSSADMRHVYADSSTTLYGQGQTVGVIGGFPPVLSDVYGNGTAGTGYVGTVGAPVGTVTNAMWPATWPPGTTMTTNAPPLLVWPAGTPPSAFSTTMHTPGENGLIDEADIDVEMVIAMAPGLDSIVVYILPGQGRADFDTVLNQMASPPAGYPLSLQLNASFNWYGTPNTPQILHTLAVQHQSLFVSSGDNGSFNAPGAGCTPTVWCLGSGATMFCNDDAMPAITTVGGTMFSASAGSPYGESEVAWSPQSAFPMWPFLSVDASSTGGIINDVAQPSYQAGFSTNGASATHRNVPDVAAPGAYAYYFVNGFGTGAFGTSVSSPIWAGYAALVNQQRGNQGLTPGIGFLNPTLYALATSNYSANFHDVTLGNNSNSTCTGFNAGTGYDLVTGLGSPTGTLLTNLAGTTLTAANEGDPHLTTVDGLHYDFQSAGEFVSLRDAGGNGVEIQTRQTPVTTAAPYTDPYTGLAECVSLNSAVAARVGSHRISYQPNISGIPDPNGMQLRVDGVLTTLPANGIDLGGGGRVIGLPAATGVIEVDFPGGTRLVVTPQWWSSYNLWYLNVDVFDTQASQGILGARAAGSWLPALPNGGALGAMPAALPQRHTDLYQTFADAWRVSGETSLFDYAPGTSTASFTLPAWPPQNGACTLPGRKPVKPMPLATAQRLCRGITGGNRNADCVFDTMAMGDAVFAKTYLASQRIEAGLSRISLRANTERSRLGQEVRFVAMVAPSSPSREKGTRVPTGTVQFTVDGRKVGAPVRLGASGEALLRTSELVIGKHQVAALYAPARGSVFLAGRSIGLAHTVEAEMSAD